LTILPSLNADVQKSTIQNITILRFAPDGDTKTIAINIKTDDISNIPEIIKEKCNELDDNDKEMQQLIDEKDIIYQKIESQGHGLHFAIFRPMVKFKPILRVSLFYRYFNDEDYTILNNETTFLGPQKVRVLGFIGYVGFSTRFLGDFSINGYAVYRIDIKSID